jgi:peptidoglycan-associated lipoprotein
MNAASPNALRSAAAAVALTFALFAPSCNSLRKGGGGPGENPYPGYEGYDGNETPLPGRDESYSFYGPGSDSVDKSQFAPVYFAFDSYAVQAGESGKVSAVAGALGSSGANLLVAGFTDSVGTDEYNRVLGERRALAVRDSLLSLGVSPERIQTVSFGEDMPADPSDDSLNRRVEFGLVR